jgi:hypothetical protein
LRALQQVFGYFGHGDPLMNDFLVLYETGPN